MRRTRRIVVDGTGLELSRWDGEGPPILLLHEGLGSVSMWRDFPEQLATASGQEVIAWSRRGHGASDPLPKRRGPDYLHGEADGVLALLDAIDVDRAHFFGHSDGGSIALIVAARYPERVASLVLEAPHVYVEQVTVDSIAKVKTVYESTDLRGKLGRHHADGDHTFWRWNDIWLDPRFRSWNIEDVLPAIAAPALLIQGRDDEYGTMDQLDRIAAVLSNTLRLELDRCGHSPHRDQARAVIGATVAFLEQAER